jgi:hypothetical protein
MSQLPSDVYRHVDDNWGSSGVAAAEYVHGLLSNEISVLEDENDGLLFERDGVEELRLKVEEAVQILNSVNF